VWKKLYLMKQFSCFQFSSTAITLMWLLMFAVIPLTLLLVTSFLTYEYTDWIQWKLTVEHYTALLNTHYGRVFLRSFLLGGLCTLICLVIAYPFSHIITFSNSLKKHKNVLLLLTIIPFWTSSLIRTYSLIAILKAHGLLNNLLIWLRIIEKPILFMYTNQATLIGLVYTLLPLMILPIYAGLEKFDKRLIDAARDLGAKGFTLFLKVIFPLVLPGILIGCTLVLLSAMTLFYVPDLLGGARTLLIGNVIQNQFLILHNWPMGSSLSVTLIVVIGLFLMMGWYYFRSLNISFYDSHS